MDALTHRTGVVAQAVCADWLAAIESRYAAVRRVGQTDRDFSIHSSSLRLTSVPGIDFEALRAVVWQGELRQWCERELGTRVACDVDQCWVRRQYAPENYPLLHAPHGWHQDGALRFDFLAHAGQTFPPRALLSMVTCWIALGPCGAEAPGLELVTRRLQGLLAPADLRDERVRARFAVDDLWRPAMAPGDALLFRGDIVHRTHVTPAMTEDRTSIELRFFGADNLPARLKGDRFLPQE